MKLYGLRMCEMGVQTLQHARLNMAAAYLQCFNSRYAYDFLPEERELMRVTSQTYTFSELYEVKILQNNTLNLSGSSSASHV